MWLGLLLAAQLALGATNSHAFAGRHVQQVCLELGEGVQRMVQTHSCSHSAGQSVVETDLLGSNAEFGQAPGGEAVFTPQ